MSDEVLERLVEAVVHDLNNYLAIISGRAGLAAERTGEAGRADLEAVIAAADAATSVLGRLASILPSVPTKLETIELDSLLRELERSMRIAAGDGITFELRAPPGLPRVRVDAAQIELALVALVENAREAMTTGGKVTIEAVASNQTVAIVVRDDGPGMERQLLKRAVDPFVTTKARREGAGLGLSIVGAIARRAGGQLRLESTRGKGTIASLVFPSLS